MKHNLSITIILVIVLSVLNFHVQGQDSAKLRSKKNVVRANITNPMIFGGNAIIIGYERATGPHQSFSLNVGRFSLPRIISPGQSLNGISLTRNTKEKGVHLSADYRFYLAKENKHNAPHGVYIGPYFSYNTFQRTNNWNLNTDDFKGAITTDFNLDIYSLGFQMGYQFILWKRVALDMLMFGPGLAQYNFDTKISTSLSAEDQSDLFAQINETLEDKLPGYRIVFDEYKFKNSGKLNVTAAGYRFVIHLGYNF